MVNHVHDPFKTPLNDDRLERTSLGLCIAGAAMLPQVDDLFNVVV